MLVRTQPSALPSCFGMVHFGTFGQITLTAEIIALLCSAFSVHAALIYCWVRQSLQHYWLQSSMCAVGHTCMIVCDVISLEISHLSDSLRGQ